MRSRTLGGPVLNLSPFLSIDRLFVSACIFALAFSVFGPLIHPRSSSIVGKAVPAVDATQPVINGSGFLRGGVYPTTQPPQVRTGVQLYGSWLGGDQPTGQVTTRWYRTAPEVSVLVAGYPDGRLEQLWAEGVDSQNRTSRVSISPISPPGETWTAVNFATPGSWTRFRLVAVDASSGIRGWVGFSEPITLAHDYFEAGKQCLLLTLSGFVAVVLLLGPGLLLRLRASRRHRPILSFLLLPLPGLLYATLVGLLAWKGPALVHPTLIARLGVALLAAACLLAFRNESLALLVTWGERRVLYVLTLLALIAISKATYSVGPVGELYGGQISRSLEVGARSDSRINYHIVQMVAARDHAYGPMISRLLAPWNFSHRGPIAGLAASVVVLVGPAKPSTGVPETSWQIFDPEGFAAYRVAMIVMACFLLCPVFALLRFFLPEAQALLGLLVVAGSPFIIHELYFTWPKIITSGLVVMSGGLAWERRFLRSGLLLGLAYLAHPSALLASPAVLALPLLQSSSVKQVFRNFKSVSGAIAQQALGAASFLFLWRVVNGRHYSQEGFLSYLRMAYNLPPTLQNWLSVRWLSLRNTVIPLHLYFFDPQNAAIVLTGLPPAILTFFIQDWTSLPSGVGLALYPCLLYWLLLGWKHARAWLLLVVILPLLLFTAYWGAFTTGLLREGLHSWVIATLCFGVWNWQTYGTSSQSWYRYTSWALLLRGVEAICMLLLPGIVTQHRIVSEQFALTDALSLAILLTACAALYWQTFQLAEQFRKAQLNSSPLLKSFR